MPVNGKEVIRLLRLHQWAKNVLVFVPPALAHRLLEPTVFLEAMMAALSLSLCASATYIVNDWLDREHDRLHPTKKTRPLAAGTVSLRLGISLAAGLFLAAFAVAWIFLPPPFWFVLAVYAGITLAYSLRLKQVPVLDVLVLAGLYALRLLAGGAATGIQVSEWLFIFSQFFFLSLALLKRYIELRMMEIGEVSTNTGRGYVQDDAAMVRGIGPACGLLAVLVFALYTSSPDVSEMYARPDLLWLIAPALTYWMIRLWLLAHRRQIHDDPVLFAVKDRASFMVLASVAGLILLAA